MKAAVAKAVEAGIAVAPNSFTGVKVFSATKARERELMGEMITDWMRAHPQYEIVDKIVTQSSDSEFHCLSITFFYREAA